MSVGNKWMGRSISENRLAMELTRAELNFFKNANEPF